jgi:hypothetical protein
MDTKPSQLDCKHTWIGQPVGYVPQSWKCYDCNTTITAGEMLLMNLLMKYMKDIESWKPFIEKYQKCMPL